MIIDRSHGGLDDPVQRPQIGRARHGHTPPYLRLDLVRLDAQEGDFVGAHAASAAGGFCGSRGVVDRAGKPSDRRSGVANVCAQLDQRATAHRQALGAGTTTHSRGRWAGKGVNHTPLSRPDWPFPAALSSSVALAPIPRSCNSNWPTTRVCESVPRARSGGAERQSAADRGREIEIQHVHGAKSRGR